MFSLVHSVMRIFGESWAFKQTHYMLVPSEQVVASRFKFSILKVNFTNDMLNHFVQQITTHIRMVFMKTPSFQLSVLNKMK